jgi:hypothetical protein
LDGERSKAVALASQIRRQRPPEAPGPSHHMANFIGEPGLGFAETNEGRDPGRRQLADLTSQLVEVRDGRHRGHLDPKLSAAG